MFADATSYFPKELPAGFAYPDDEPAFDPRRHLALEKPRRMISLAELGYDPDIVARMPSRFALSEPCRLLSPEGIEALREVFRLQHARMRAADPANWDIRKSTRSAAYRSRFHRDLALSPEVATFMSELFEAPLVPHVQGHFLANHNFAVEADGRAANGARTNATGWHFDVVAFDYVMMVHDPKTVEGGRFQYFDGTTEEGSALVAERGDLPHNRIVEPDYPQAGYAVFMQGCAVYHRGGPLQSRVANALGYRSSYVNCYVTRDVSKPDTNRTFFTETPASATPKHCLYPEYARRKAWIARAKLGTLIEDLPFTEDRKLLAQRLRDAIADVTETIGKLESENLSAAEELAKRREPISRAYFGLPPKP